MPCTSSTSTQQIGTLTEVQSSPVVFDLPPIVRPQGVAVYLIEHHPDGG